MLNRNQPGLYDLLLMTACFCLATLTGCTVGPNYQPPKAQVPSAWSQPSSAPAGASADEILVHWWTAFNDPTLTTLVERAVQSNLTVKQAEARIRQARAARGVARAGFWPTVDATGTESFSRSPGTGGSSRLLEAGLDASWELDIFGGTRRNVEAATADLAAAVEDHRDALVTLAGEVALNYVELRGLQQRIAIAQKNLEAQQHTAKVTKERFEGGFVGALDVANANAQVATTASQIPVLEILARQTIYNLGVLLGAEPSALVAELSETGGIPAAAPDVPLGVPSDLLRRRPDIRRAEVQIHAATARIGVATADLFPRLTVTGAAGFQGSQFDSWLQWTSRFASVGPSVDWQIFNAGKVTNNIEVQKALTEQAVLTYRQSVLTALQDVENALIASTKEQEHRKALADAVEANRKAVDLSMQLYIQGLGDFLNVLDAQRSLYSSEDALVQSTQTMSIDLVALYKALGGGWSSTP